jgi:alpha-tubulin suppressor-like RCC1 family protein
MLLSGIYTGGYGEMRLLRSGGSSISRADTSATFAFFFTGWKFSLLWSQSGGWFGGGVNDNGVLGPDIPSSGVREVRPIPALSQITPRWGAAGDKFAMIVDCFGECHVCGKLFTQHWRPIELAPDITNRFLFCACGEETWCLIPEGARGVVCKSSSGAAVHHTLGQDVVDCACGRRHFVAVAQDGRLFSWGTGKACGQGTRKFRATAPTEVRGIPPMARVFAYHDMTLAIDRDGFVWGSGRNNAGQLGLGEINRTNGFKKLPPFPEPLVHIAVGEEVAHFLGVSGRVFVCGSSDGRRIISPGSGNIRVPRPVTEPHGLIASWISVGWSS